MIHYDLPESLELAAQVMQRSFDRFDSLIARCVLGHLLQLKLLRLQLFVADLSFVMLGQNFEVSFRPSTLRLLRLNCPFISNKHLLELIR